MSQPDQDPMDKLKELKEKQEELKVLRDVKKAQEEVNKLQSEIDQLDQNNVGQDSKLKDLKEREEDLKELKQIQESKDRIEKMEAELADADAQSKLITGKPDAKGIIPFNEERYQRQLKELQQKKGIKARFAVLDLKMFKAKIKAHNGMIRATEKGQQISGTIQKASKHMDSIGRQLGQLDSSSSATDNNKSIGSEYEHFFKDEPSKHFFKTGKQNSSKRKSKSKRHKHKKAKAEPTEQSTGIGKSFEHFFE